MNKLSYLSISLVLFLQLQTSTATTLDRFSAARCRALIKEYNEQIFKKKKDLNADAGVSQFSSPLQFFLKRIELREKGPVQGNQKTIEEALILSGGTGRIDLPVVLTPIKMWESPLNQVGFFLRIPRQSIEEEDFHLFIVTPVITETPKEYSRRARSFVEGLQEILPKIPDHVVEISLTVQLEKTGLIGAILRMD